jgi:hypothetical protein
MEIVARLHDLSRSFGLRVRVLLGDGEPKLRAERVVMV